MARPSPRTQGVSATGETFQKFGTQQLDFVKPPVLGTPYQGVVQVDTGKDFKGFTSSLIPSSGLTTAFSKQFQSGMTGSQKSESREVAIKMQEEKLKSMGIPFTNVDWSKLKITTQLSDLFPDSQPNGNGNGTGECVEDNPLCGFTELIGGEKCKCPNWFGWDVGAERGCECEACKNGTGQCSDKVPHCDAWDLLCEGTGGASVGVVGGTDIWLWVKIILVVIGIGVLLWLLRPLFGMIGAFKGGSP